MNTQRQRAWPRPLGRLLATVTGVIGIASAAAQPTDWDIRGEAVDPDSGELLFTEYHRTTDDGNGRPIELVVDYILPDGNPLARKELRFNLGYRYLPELDWIDHESSTTIAGRWQNGEYRQTIENSDPREAIAEIPEPEAVIFDAAFDPFLVNHFTQLRRDGRMEFEFLSLGADRTYSFRAVIDSEADHTVNVHIEPASQVARWFVDPLTAVYDVSGTPRLVQFRGVTNFRRNGDLLKADITYEYARR